MTQKELLYMEDAIGHEKNIISILEVTINNLKDDNLCNFILKKIHKHEKILDKLLKTLEEESNEWSIIIK